MRPRIGPGPRGRTTLIIAAAALLGIVGRVAVGYGVQAEPAAADRAPAPLPAAQDRRVTTDGDLRKLLVDRPKGARKTLVDEPGLGDGWEPLDQYVERSTT